MVAMHFVFTTAVSLTSYYRIEIEYKFISYTILHTCIQFNIRLYKKEDKENNNKNKKNMINKKHPFVVCN